MNRIVTAAVSVALLGFAPAAVSTSATAATPQVAATTVASEASVDARAAATRTVRIGYGARNGKAFIKGSVSPRYARKPVFVQKGTCSATACTWKRYKKVRTDRRSRYRATVFVPRTGRAIYRVMVPASGGYSVSYSKPLGLYWK